ncbi:replicative DNA helicase [Deferribacterales bacterium]|nr:replicative DNA helicase [Deferribacterales bacterium]
MEQAVLACLMLEAGAFDKINGTIKEHDFYSPRNRRIFGAITRLNDEGQPYDINLVLAALRSSGNLEIAGGVEYVNGLTYIIPNAANIEKYAGIVKSKAKLRELTATATKICEDVYEADKDTTGDVTKVIDIAGQMVYELAQDSTSSNPEKLAEFLPNMYERLEKLHSSNRPVVGLPTDFYDLDDIMSGLQNGSLIVIAARPGMGKTALALNIATNVAEKHNVVMFSLEMTKEQLLDRVVSGVSHVDSKKLQTGRFNDTEWAQISGSDGKVRSLNLYVADNSNIDVGGIRSVCRRLKTKKDTGGLDLVIIDYLQLMEEKSIDSREQQVSSISRNLKGLAKELNIPIIALAQLNRLLEARKDKRPMLSDLRESGAIEQDADQVLFIHREEMYNEDTADKGIAEVIVSKNRNGPTGTARLGFVKELTLFRNLENRYSGGL